LAFPSIGQLYAAGVWHRQCAQPDRSYARFTALGGVCDLVHCPRYDQRVQNWGRHVETRRRQEQETIERHRPLKLEPDSREQSCMTATHMYCCDARIAESDI